MLKNNTVPILLGAVVLVTLATADGYRSKRQAPNINVHEIPKTSFSCADKKVGEYYADPESHCQVYHVCIPGMHNKMSLISFVCPNGTIFSQATKVCTPYDRVDCSLTSKFVSDSGRDFGSDDYDNYVPPPQPQAPRPAPQPSRSRNTPAPPPPQSTTPPRSSNRFRSNQFRSNQAPTTAAPARTTAAPPPPPARAAPARPAPPAFRPPVPAARPTPRAVVSTSTASYNYEYEYEYDYEDEAPGEQAGNSRTRRSAESGFSCEDKVPGGAYADVESNCEMFHICVLMGKSKILDYKVHCANGTAFDQETGSCREKDEFVCENAQLFFQFEKQNQPKSSKKPVISKKQYYKSKKIASPSKE